MKKGNIVKLKNWRPGLEYIVTDDRDPNNIEIAFFTHIQRWNAGRMEEHEIQKVTKKASDLTLIAETLQA